MSSPCRCQGDGYAIWLRKTIDKLREAQKLAREAHYAPVTTSFIVTTLTLVIGDLEEELNHYTSLKVAKLNKASHAGPCALDPSCPHPNTEKCAWCTKPKPEGSQ